MLHRQEDYSETIEIRLNGSVYNEHLVFLLSEDHFYKKNNQLHCWNMSIQSVPFLFLIILDTNSWRIFNVRAPGRFLSISKLVVYENSLWIVGESLREEDICLATYNLDSKKKNEAFFSDSTDLCLEAPISPQEQHLKSLFMNEEKSDVKFKVQDQIIPAHKEVLIKKAKCFAGLFKSKNPHIFISSLFSRWHDRGKSTYD